MPKIYDIAVLGGTAAGYVAAEALAKKGHSVIVLSSSATAGDTEAPLGDWIPADIFTAWLPLRKVRTAATDWPFRAVHFHSADLKGHAVYRSRSVAGFVLRPVKFIKTLAESARQSGARILRLKHRVEISLRETFVILNEKASSQREFRAAVLLVAAGRPSEIMNSLAIPGQNAPEGRVTIGELAVRLRPADRKSMDKDVHIVAFAEGERFGMFFQGACDLHVRIIHLVGGDSHSAAAVVRFIRGLQQADLLPKTLDLSKATAGLWHPPGGAALEMDTHTAKRTLLLGTAGGFASAMTGATLGPAIISALVAADVADRALRSNRLQETLADFKDQWRETLAGCIRPPGMPLQMMLPMAMTNKTMTARFAKAFLYGQSI